MMVKDDDDCDDDDMLSSAGILRIWLFENEDGLT